MQLMLKSVAQCPKPRHDNFLFLLFQDLKLKEFPVRALGPRSARELTDPNGILGMYTDTWRVSESPDFATVESESLDSGQWILSDSKVS